MNKRIYPYGITALVILITTLIFSSCGSKDPSPKETNIKLLTNGTWTINSVKVSGVDKTNLFTGMTITFTETDYTAVNGGPIWGSSQSWSFIDNSAKSFSISSGVEVDIIELTGTSLIIELTWDKTTLDGGRTKSVEGRHEFIFTK